jgi:hypothetical protein
MMADVFISYKSEEWHVAKRIELILETFDLRVWLDRKLRGEIVEPEIRRQIGDAAAVVVLLSRRFIQSDWIYGETKAARAKIVLAQIDDLPPDDVPLFLQKWGIINLSDWHDEADHPEIRKLIERCLELKRASVGRHGGSQNGAVETDTPPPDEKERARKTDEAPRGPVSANGSTVVIRTANAGNFVIGDYTRINTRD